MIGSIRGRRRVWWLAGVATAIVLGGGWVALFYPHVPSVQGKPVTYWIERLDGPQVELAQEAILSLGSNAVPYLLDGVHRRQSRSQKFNLEVWAGIPRSVRKFLPAPKLLEDYGSPDRQIIRCLDQLGPASSLPSLKEALGCRDSQVLITDLATLAGFGDQASECLAEIRRLMHHSNGFVRRWAVFASGRMGSASAQAIPDLVDALHDDESSPLPGSPARVRQTATRVLGQIGPEARAAVPRLKELLAQSDPDLRREAAIALWKIDRDREVVTHLIEELDRMNGEKREVFLILREMGPLARAAVPSLKRIIDPSDLRGGRYTIVRGVVPPSRSAPTKAPPNPVPPRDRTEQDLASDALRAIDPAIDSAPSETIFSEPPGLLLGR